MQLNPSAVLVPCAFPAIGRDGQGAAQDGAETGRRGRRGRGEGSGSADRRDRSAEARRVCGSKRYSFSADFELWFNCFN